MIKPTFPRPDSLTGRALARLIQGKRFTHRDFQNQTASYRLSGYIEHLRKTHNWIIQTDYEQAPTKDPTGRNATYGRYSIEPELLAEYRKQLGERFDGFIESVSKFENGGANGRT